MLNIKYIDIDNGKRKFDGGANLFGNMLITFDSLTLDDSL